MDWWRDLEPGVRWLAAAGAFAGWYAVLAVTAALARPRQVGADPTVVDLPGGEPAAVAGTLTDRWVLSRDAMPATLLDLAARGHISIRAHGEHAESVVVYVPDHRTVHEPFPLPGDENGETLTSYERMVLVRLRRRARLTRDGGVVAAALLHGTRTGARRWWRQFRKAVYEDMARRDLARRGRPAWAVLVAIVASLATALTFGAALAGSVYGSDASSDGDVAWGVAVYGLFASIGLLVAAFRHPRLRATPAGREAAARWLGLRNALTADPLLTTTGTAGLSGGGRRMAYAAAMGVVPASIAPFASMGRGSRREIWSPVTGQWRQVRLRRPAGSFGSSPGGAIAVGGLFFLLASFWMGTALVSSLDADAGLAKVLLLMIVLPLSPFLAVTVWAVVRGVSDLTTGHRPVEGHVLRLYSTRENKRPVWYAVVDDGTSAALRPWRFAREPGFSVNARVRAEVTPALGHVRHLEVLDAGEPHPTELRVMGPDAFPLAPDAGSAPPDGPPTAPSATPPVGDGALDAEAVSRPQR